MPSFSALFLAAAAAGSSYAALEAYGAPAPAAYGYSPRSTEVPSSSAPVYQAPEQSYAPKSDEYSSHEPQWYSSPAPEYTTTQAAEYGLPSQTYAFEATISCTDEEEMKPTSSFVPYYTNEETTQFASSYNMYSTISIDTSSHAATSASAMGPKYSNVTSVPYYPVTTASPSYSVEVETPSASMSEEHQSSYNIYPTISIDTASYATTSASVMVPKYSNVTRIPYYHVTTASPSYSVEIETPSASMSEEHQTYSTQIYEQSTLSTEEAHSYPASTAPVYQASQSASYSAPYQSASYSAPAYQPSESASYSAPYHSASYSAPAYQPSEAASYSAPVYQPSESASYSAPYQSASYSAPVYQPSESAASSGNTKYVYSTVVNTVTCEACKETVSWAATAPVVEYQPSPSASVAYPIMSQESAPASASASVMEYQPSASASIAYPGVPASSATATTIKEVTIVPVPATESPSKPTILATYPGAASPTGYYGNSNGAGNSTAPWNKPESYTGGASVNSFSIAVLTIAVLGAAFAL